MAKAIKKQALGRGLSALLKDPENDIKSIRPGFGLHPKYFKEVLGKKVKRNLSKGDRVSFSDFK